MHFLRQCTIVLVALPFAASALACSRETSPHTTPQRFEIIAHRGVHPFYYGEDAIDRRSGCSATLMREAGPAFIENTVSSMDAAFRSGATMIELDVHRTADNQLVVFHDAGLECRTNGKGAPESHALADLKKLDAGYGYTIDGKTFPFRGTGIGLIPSLREVLDTFPGGRFVIDDKVAKGSTPRLIGELLSAYALKRQRNVIYWGSASAYAEVRARAPGVGGRLMTRGDMVACRNAILRRLAVGPLPNPCRGATLIIPALALHPWSVRVALGWPDRFIAKVHGIGSQIVIATDSADEAAALRRLAIDGIMTDRIQIVGPRLK